MIGALLELHDEHVLLHVAFMCDSKSAWSALYFSEV